MSSTIILIEDNAELATFLQDMLHRQGFLVFVANSGTDGLSLVDKYLPELVLLDLFLPDINGYSVCEKIRTEHPDTRIMILTAQGERQEIVKGLNSGADDYLVKPLDINELIARVKVQLRRVLGDNTQVQVADLSLDPNSHVVKRSGRIITLSPQEFRLLYYFMVHEGKVLSRDIILSHIWKGNPDLQTRIVDVYVGYIRKKIDFKEPKLIHSVRGFGYVLRDRTSNSNGKSSVKVDPSPKRELT